MNRYIWNGFLVSCLALGFSSCNNFLDREPVTDVTPESYFSSADQLGAYVIKGYDQMTDSRGQLLYHKSPTWDAGITLNDQNTDNYIKGQSISQDYFAGNKQVPTGQTIGGYADQIRYWNYFLDRILPMETEHKISGSEEDINQYIGEAYFFRAMTYYKGLVAYGDFPIVKTVLKDKEQELISASERQPRNEVARFILQDLDNAIAKLHDKGYMNNQRINKQVAQLFKSRVALFEGTFEKYHQGTGRVPGDANWPGKDMSYNKGKAFNIPGEIDFFLTQAMDAAKAVADVTPLTENSHVYEPAKINDISGWNKYFDMFSTPDLSSFGEVLLWRQYNPSLGLAHDAAYILNVGGNDSGITKGFVSAFLMKNGLPIYAAGSGYNGDVDPRLEPLKRDDRLQLFVCNPNTVIKVDTKNPAFKTATEPAIIDTISLVPAATELRDVTGYRPRKFMSYSYEQHISNQVICFTGCPVFRGAEAYLNYIEACYEKNHSIDATADKYWRAIRERAGVDPDYQKTINATDMAKEADVENGTILGDLGVYSGDHMVDATLYNIRRERRCEFISEGMRWADLKRWRSWDPLIEGHYQMQGINLWTQEYKRYIASDGTSPLDKPNVISTKDVSVYIRPLQTNKVNNPLYDGMTWKKAYYLEPIGVRDLTINETKANDLSSSTMYQNPYWPTTVAKALE